MYKISSVNTGVYYGRRIKVKASIWLSNRAHTCLQNTSIHGGMVGGCVSNVSKPSR